jgi:AraC-like DNA-binding protein
MSKNTTFYEKLKKNAVWIFREDTKEIKIKICQWGFMEVEEWYYPKVCLQEWILYWNVTPGQKLEVNGRIIHPDVEKIYLFPPYTRFGGIIENNFIQFYIHFLASSPFDSVRSEFITFDSDFIKENVYKTVSSSSDIIQSLCLTQIAMAALAHVPQKMLIQSQKNILDSRIRHVLEKINKSPGASYSVEELADSVKMSVNNFHRIFQNYTFSTPKQYILCKRMEFSRDLLMNGLLSIDEIAEQSGFRNRYHFSKVFKNYYSMPPITYRKFMIDKNQKKGLKI